MYGGSSRTNRSIAFAVNNATFATGQSISVDAGNGVVILADPLAGHFTDASFQFSYRVTGSQYAWYEKYFLGPDGTTWLYVSIAVASLFALILLIIIIWGFVACARRFCCKPKISPDQVQILSHQPVNQNTNRDGPTGAIKLDDLIADGETYQNEVYANNTAKTRMPVSSARPYQMNQQQNMSVDQWQRNVPKAVDDGISRSGRVTD